MVRIASDGLGIRLAGQTARPHANVTPRFLADENIDPDLVLGLLRVNAEIDVVRVQDVGLRSADDRTILEWAASEGRLLLTHDISTVSDFAHERVAQGLSMAGVFIINAALPMHGPRQRDRVVLGQVPADGFRAGVQPGLGQLLAQGQDQFDGGWWGRVG
jgi:predicted nuclease of predicted toxin-antitoxin system